MEARDFPSLYHAEAVKGEKAAYFLRWVIVLTLLPAAVLMLATGRYMQAVPYSFTLIGVCIAYNLLLTSSTCEMTWINRQSSTSR